MTEFRTEHDALGPVEVPIDSYAGSFHTRASTNFQNSSLKAYPSFKRAFAWIKMAAAKVNAAQGHLGEAEAKAIVQAAEEFIEGRYDNDYDLDVYQAGAGTPFNMNLNEILANRANEILAEQGLSEGKRGVYSPVHPNNHVNMAQSSNDTNPTAIRIAALMDLKPLFSAGNDLIQAMQGRAEEFKDHVKVGRTHLQDAVPITLGQEFEAYVSSLRRCMERLDAARGELMELGIGGNATGSGINTHPDFSKNVCKELGSLSGLDLFPTHNRFETTHSMAPFLAVSSALRALATELLRISNDLRLMASGPYAGFGDIELPEVEPGSSIMPGKVNPSIPEAMSLICCQVMGLDHTIALCSQQGQLELNWHTPVIMWDLLHMIEILGNGMQMFQTFCIEQIVAKKDHMEQLVHRSTATATALAPYMGYHEVAELVNEAIEKDVPFVDLVPEEQKHHLDVMKMTRPSRD